MPPLRFAAPAALILAAITPACSSLGPASDVEAWACPVRAAAASQDLPAWVPAPNFQALTPTVAGSGTPPLTAIAGLPEQGYGALIDLRLPSEPGYAEERSAAAAAGLRWIAVPISGSNFDLADAAALRAALDEAGDAKVLLHCRSGSRVGALWALMQATGQGLTPTEAESLALTSGAAPRLALRVREQLIAAQRRP